MEHITMKIEVFGKVQGVGFRFFVCQIAEECSISGTVRNREDAAVEIFAHGTQKNIDKFIKKCQKGNGWSKVVNIEFCAAPDCLYNGFIIKR